VSCYFRHMKDVLEELGVEVTPANKKEIDAAIHKAVGVEYKNCSPAWKAVKERIRTDEKARAAFLKVLQKSLP
jgi:molecular chaperone GrpE (heat shock protein)